MRWASVLVVSSVVASARAQEDPYPLSRQLQVVEKDLTDADYHAVLKTMISTDLRAEWQRVAAPDNHRVFAKLNGGMDKVVADPKLLAAYDRRKRLCDEFLKLMRSAYVALKAKAPFDDPALLDRVLDKAEPGAVRPTAANVTIAPILPAGSEKQWPGLGGPTGRNIVLDSRLPDRWSATQNVRWKTKLPGRGNSAAVVWGDRVFVTSERALEDGAKVEGVGPDRLLLCYDRRDGKLLWEHASPRPKELEKLYWKNTLASATPVCDGSRVVAFLGNGGLLCCDLDGKRLWHRDLGTFPTMHGPGASPVLYKDLAILMQDQTKGESLCAAFDLKTGETRWSRKRRNRACWCTPVLLRVGDRDELIHNGSFDIVSYDPATGEELWRSGGTSEESIPAVNAGAGMIFSMSGRNGPVFALRPGGTGDITQSHVIWRNETGGPHVPSPAFHDGRLFAVNDTGIVTCLDANSGKVIWQQRLKGRFSTSPLLAGDRLLMLNEEGVSYILKAGDKFELLAAHTLGETTYATPAAVDGRLYFRTATSLICVGE